MSRRKNTFNKELPGVLQAYAKDRALDFHRYSDYHMRITDGGFVMMDFWTSDRYWIGMTDYQAMGTDKIERAGEKGTLPDTQFMLPFLDGIFYPDGPA